MNYVLAFVAMLALAGCSATAAINTCDAIDAGHDVFLDEVDANPAAYTEKELRNERLAYAAAKIACTSYVRTKANAG